MLNIKNILSKRLLGVAVAAAALITPAIASAQDIPAYASAGTGQQIQGTISAINGEWNITIADSSGYNDSVALHQGTIINPTGLTLEPGMNVTVDGYADGSNFDANEIDTPYQYQGPPPVAVYYGPGSWYPGYAYGWGPSFSLFFDSASNRFEQRSFNYGGEVRHAMAPPSGWQDRPHGYVGNAGNAAVTSHPQTHPYYGPPQQGRTFAATPQTRAFAGPPQQTRTFAAPPQQTRSYVGPPQQMRTVAAPPQQTRAFAGPPQQTRAFAVNPQQTRTFAAPPQQARNFAAPTQRSYSAPAGRAANAAPAARAANTAPRGNQNGGNRRPG